MNTAVQAVVMVMYTAVSTLPKAPAPTVKPTPPPLPPIYQTGAASWYDHHAGNVTASGETVDEGKPWCAHRYLPLHTLILVTNPANGKSITLRINDRGPYVGGRILDLTPFAFWSLCGNLDKGVLHNLQVRVLQRGNGHRKPVDKNAKAKRWSPPS